MQTVLPSKQAKYQLVPLFTQTSSCGASWLRRLCQCFHPATHSSAVMPEAQALSILPPQSAASQGKKTLVLDLDETLVHSTFLEMRSPDAVVRISTEDGRETEIYVRHRPGLKNFLDSLAPLYELVVFTASMSNYAEKAIDSLDPSNRIEHRLFRESCTKIGDIYTKDLSLLGRDLSQVILLDVTSTQNSPDACLLQPGNSIIVKSFLAENDDIELLRLIPLLKDLEKVRDVREVLHHTADVTSSSIMIPTFGKRHSDVTDGTVTEVRPEFSIPR